MRRRGNREVQIFNFSFLDVIACTVGALVFILIIIVINSHHVKFAGASSAVAEPPPIASAPPDPAALEAQAQRQQQAEAKLALQRDRIASLTGQLRQLEAELAEVTRTATAAVIEREFSYRLPMLRETTKECGVMFECDAERTFLLGAGGDLYRHNFEIEIVRHGILAKFVRKSTAWGEDENQLRNPDSLFQKTMRTQNPQFSFVSFFVKPSGMKVFRRAREILWQKGFDSNWVPFDASQEYLIPLTGGSGGGPRYTQ